MLTTLTLVVLSVTCIVLLCSNSAHEKDYQKLEGKLEQLKDIIDNDNNEMQDILDDIRLKFDKITGGAILDAHDGDTVTIRQMSDSHLITLIDILAKDRGRDPQLRTYLASEQRRRRKDEALTRKEGTPTMETRVSSNTHFINGLRKALTN